MKSSVIHQVFRCEATETIEEEQQLIGEEPLSIVIEGAPYSVVMRTPGDEISLAAGFCLAEGIVDCLEDFATLGYCEQLDPNVISVTLVQERKNKVESILQRRGYISQTSCGICGKELVKDLNQSIEPNSDATGIQISQAMESINQLLRHQDLYKKNQGAHAAVLFDAELNPVTFGEDVGRHNALDKAIGKALMERKLTYARLAALSSRISYELVQKAARARIPVLVSMSRPTSLAVILAKSLNMSLACISKDNKLLIFCGEERFHGK